MAQNGRTSSIAVEFVLTERYGHLGVFGFRTTSPCSSNGLDQCRCSFSNGDVCSYLKSIAPLIACPISVFDIPGGERAKRTGINDCTDGIPVTSHVGTASNIEARDDRLRPTVL